MASRRDDDKGSRRQGLIAGESTNWAGLSDSRWAPPDGRRLLQLALATIWLLDGVLQLQPFMFTPGAHGFSGMLAGTATGNPRFIAHTITWNASVVQHHAVAADAAFALIQFLIGLGIAWRPSVRPALALSIVWSLSVWWFGEGLGGLLHGAGTPVGGGPGAVLFYALLAVLLWPSDRIRTARPFVAAWTVGTQSAKVIWVVIWLALAVLTLLGSGRSPDGLRNLIVHYDGEPGWMADVDRHAASLLAGHGLAVATGLAAICVVVAVGVFLPVVVARATIILALMVAIVIWVVGENFGTVLAGGATDPNSGPLLVLLALAYWPKRIVAADGMTTAAASPYLVEAV